MSEPTKAAPHRLGSLWEIASKADVKVTRPDGSEVRVGSDGKVAAHVLDVAGTYSADVDGKPQTVEAL